MPELWHHPTAPMLTRSWDWDHFQMLCRTYADDVKSNPKGVGA